MKKRHRVRLRLEGFTCINCGYDLRGHHIGERCPECGWDVGESLADIDQLADDWAERAIGQAVLAVLLGWIPAVGVFVAWDAWRSSRAAVAAADHERIESSRRWAERAGLAAIVAVTAGVINLLITGWALVWVFAWLRDAGYL